MARTVTELGPGGQPHAAREPQPGRLTSRTGLRARDRGIVGRDALALHGRKRAAGPLPNRLKAIQASVASQSQAAPQCRSTRLSTRLTAAAVRRQLSAHQGAADRALPAVDTIGTTWHELGDSPQQVTQRQPQKTSRHGRHLRPRHEGQSGGRGPQVT